MTEKEKLELFEKYKGYVYAINADIKGNEDGLQNGMMVLWEIIVGEKFDESKGSFSTFCYKVLRQKMIEFKMREDFGIKYSSGTRYEILKYVNMNKDNLTEQQMYDYCKQKYKINLDIWNLIYSKKID